MAKENKYSKIALRNLKIIIDMSGISIGTFEKATGVSQGYFSRFNKTNGLPSFEVIVCACKYLEVSVDEIIKDDLLNEIKSYEGKSAIV